ncbi:Trm112 family protein [Achromobacter sp. F4_2707]|uniref:Trm112 family protein n=1 Tax=Achromobacter sp. F4_2707 TaxID=3114286 RepID=UPI0039C5D19C
MESRLLEILVCPICKSSLRYDRQQQELICRADRLAFPVRDGVPIMLENEARDLDASEPQQAEPAQTESQPQSPQA